MILNRFTLNEYNYNLFKYNLGSVYSYSYVYKKYAGPCHFVTQYATINSRCLVSLFVTNEANSELPESYVSIEKNMFYINRIGDASTVCAFSQFADCNYGLNSSNSGFLMQPIRVNNNSFVANTNNFEIFGIDDFFDLTHNWWNTLSVSTIAGKIQSNAQMYNYGTLYQSEQSRLTATPTNMYGVNSRICTGEFVEFESKCFFLVASSVSYAEATLVCSMLYASLAQYSSELAKFIAESSGNFSSRGVWFDGQKCSKRANLSDTLNLSRCEAINSFVCEQEAFLLTSVCGDDQTKSVRIRDFLMIC